jgi:hypothetical protein
MLNQQVYHESRLLKFISKPTFWIIWHCLGLIVISFLLDIFIKNLIHILIKGKANASSLKPQIPTTKISLPFTKVNKKILRSDKLDFKS